MRGSEVTAEENRTEQNRTSTVERSIRDGLGLG